MIQKKKFHLTVLCCLAVLDCHRATGQSELDWPQWRGPGRTDISREKNLLEEWPAEGPPRMWLFENAGDGYSGFAIVGQRLYTLGADDRNEFALCLDASSGKEIWRRPVGPRFDNSWGDGPRSTPTYRDNRIFVLSATGFLSCLEAADGSVVWQHDLADFGGKRPFWGYSESVLVDQGQVVCTPGGAEGAVIAFDAKSGNRKWQSSLFTPDAQYSSIIVADHPEGRHYVILSMKAVCGIDPQDGRLLWTHRWAGRTAVIPTPIYSDRRVYVTSANGIGAMLVDISNLSQPKEVWFNRVMKNQHGGVILIDGHVYGYSDNVGWVCQELETGKRVWYEKDALEKGSITYADGRFYLLTENRGEVVLIDATIDGWKERGRFKLSPLSERRKPEGGIWVHPVVAHGKLFLRDQEKIFCYNVRR